MSFSMQSLIKLVRIASSRANIPTSLEFLEAKQCQIPDNMDLVSRQIAAAMKDSFVSCLVGSLTWPEGK